ncbi:MAG: class I mannose-6-phosphate isomerase [Anaerolineae bacterium]
MADITAEKAAAIAQSPLKLAYNRVWRVYRGGYLLDAMRRADSPSDGHFPEDWATSDTQALNEGREGIVEGLSEALLPGGERLLLRDLLLAAPEAYLGAAHVRAYGSKLALLVKLLDSAERLQLQVHPSREYSRRYLNDRFGKTESWVVLGTRRVADQDPYILMGFRERVDKATMTDLVQRQDVAGMEQTLNKLAVEPGDMYVIRAGMPHAIGPGVFMVEVQEPTDWVVSAERQMGEVLISERAAFMGVGLDLAMDAFDFDGLVGMDAVAGATLRHRPGHLAAEKVLVGSEDTDCFSANELTIASEVSDPYRGRAYSGIVVEGAGEIVLEQGSLRLNRGDTFFVPASARHLGYRAQGAMRVIASFPPAAPGA